MTIYKRNKSHCFERAIRTAEERVFHESKEAIYRVLVRYHTVVGILWQWSDLIKSEIETQIGGNVQSHAYANLRKVSIL